MVFVIEKRFRSFWKIFDMKLRLTKDDLRKKFLLEFFRQMVNTVKI